MLHVRIVVAAFGLLVLGPTAAAQVVVPTLFNTGVTSAGALLADGAVDPHYQLLTSASASYPVGSPLYVVNSTTYPIPPWMANGPNSKWLSVQTVPAGVAAGTYTYRTTFDLTGYNPSSASIIGQWAMDDDGLDILINGASTGFSYSGPNQFGFFHPFSISTGFVPGVNTLDFVVHNRIDRIGIRTEMSLTAVPEPSSLATFGMAVTFAASWRQLRRKWNRQTSTAAD